MEVILFCIPENFLYGIQEFVKSCCNFICTILCNRYCYTLRNFFNFNPQPETQQVHTTPNYLPFLVHAVFGSCCIWFVLFLVCALFGLCSFWFVLFLIRALFGSCPLWFVLFLSHSTFSRIIQRSGRDRLRGLTQPKSSA